MTDGGTEGCNCEVCSDQEDHPFLSATKEDLSKLPPLPSEIEEEMRMFAKKLRQRAEEDLEQELL